MRPVATDRLRERLRATAGALLEQLPEAPAPVVQSGYTVRRAVERVPRNEPCPCGSGKKYKRCCLAADQERLRHSSEVAGVTIDELHEHPEERVTWKRLHELRSHELVRLDAARVPVALRGASWSASRSSASTSTPWPC